MKTRLLMISAALSLMILWARPGSAQAAAAPEPVPRPQWLGKMLEEGWREAEAGVLERRTGGNRVETFTYGQEGRRFTARRLLQRIRSLQREQSAYPSPELARVIATLQSDLARTNASLSDAKAGGSGLEVVGSAVTCVPTVTYQADAGPLLAIDAPGVTASAKASFHSTCGELGNVFSYAHARATPEGGTLVSVRTDEEPRHDGASLASAASVSVSGSLGCYSQAFARAWSATVDYQVTEENYQCPGPAQRPFLGKPFAVPGKFKAADFDEGGEGVAYHGVTRSSTVGNLEAGDWMEYTIDVGTAGTYALVAEVTTTEAGGSFHVELDGVDVTGPITVPVTVWSVSGSAVKTGIKFPAGRHVLRFVADSWFESFRSLRIVVAQAPFGGTAWTLPGTIRARDFDEGGEQVSYHDNSANFFYRSCVAGTPTCLGSIERPTDDVDFKSSGVTSTSTGEWMEYTVDVTAAGTYTLAIRLSAECEVGSGIIHVEFDGVDVTGPITVPATGSVWDFQTVTRSVTLSAGRQVMRLVVDYDGGNYWDGAGTFDTITVQP
ncbi:MAG TPA: carbohydrate-binding protein [Thermoanaerobaculia bacterium]